MTVTEQPRQNAHHPTDPARPASSDQPVPVAALVEARLADEALTEPVKVLLKEALGDGEPRGTSLSAGSTWSPSPSPGSVASDRVPGSSSAPDPV